MRSFFNKDKLLLVSFYAISFFLIGFLIVAFYNANKQFYLQEDRIELIVGETYSATILDKKNQNVDHSNYIWTSLNDNIAIVDDNGSISALKPGKVEIEVKSKKGYATRKIFVSVQNQEIKDIKFEEEIILSEDGTTKLNPILNDNLLIEEKLEFESENEEIVKVDEEGNLVANKPGSTSVNVSAGNGVTGQVDVVVKETVKKVETIQFNISTFSLEEGAQKELEVIINPEDAETPILEWSSSNTNVATVNSKGLLIAKNKGETTITVKTNNGKTATCNITVKEKVVKALSVSLNETKVTMTVGDQKALTATINPGNTTNKTITWKSSNTNVAIVDSSGTVKAVSPGTAKIKVTTSNGKTATCEITVKTATVQATSISLNETKATMTVGNQKTLTATINPGNTTNKTITWKSSNTKVVTVDSSGTVKAVSPGTAKITVTTSNGKTATCEITVNKKPVAVTGITLNSSKGTVYLNATKNTVKLSPTVTPSDATNKTITWKSSNTKIATVDSSGTVKAVSPGTAKITATTNNGKTATYSLTVRQKVIMVITASAGERMCQYYTEYKSPDGYKYVAINNHLATEKEKETYCDERGMKPYKDAISTGKTTIPNLFYLYNNGSGFSYQYGEGTDDAGNPQGIKRAKEVLNSNYGDKKNYIDLTIYFTLTGNSVKDNTCAQIRTTTIYETYAEKYHNAIQSIKDAGYTNTKGIVMSHNPLNTKYAIKTYPDKAKTYKIVYSKDANYCSKGYRSAYKYWISNRRMESLLQNSTKYKNIKFLDAYSNIVTKDSPKDDSVITFTWKCYSNCDDPNKRTLYDEVYKTTDGLHWNSQTTKIYMKLAFDQAENNGLMY